MSRIICGICPHLCSLNEGQAGFCRARSNIGGVINDDNYGFAVSLALDPIEKKPLARFHPGSRILSYGSFGCNMRCPFCQNHEISQAGKGDLDAKYIPPEELVRQALELVPRGNIGIAYTYNEPLVGYEYVMDCSRLAAEKGLKNVLVTNGYINGQPLLELLPFIHAMNIDLKGFTEKFYHELAGDLETVKRTIILSAERCHVEVTTLVIPGKNDSLEEMDALSAWIASVRKDIPLHISRFFPRYHMQDREPTSLDKIRELALAAEKHLPYVYKGNC